MIEAFRIGGELEGFVRVTILDRPWEGTRDRFDGNMVECQFEISLGAIRASFRENASLFDFKSFGEEVGKMNRALKGTAKLRQLSGALSLDLEMDALGHVRVSGEACASHFPLQKVVFDMGNEIDQTHLASLQQGIEKALATYPIFEG